MTEVKKGIPCYNAMYKHKYTFLSNLFYKNTSIVNKNKNTT